MHTCEGILCVTTLAGGHTSQVRSVSIPACCSHMYRPAWCVAGSSSERVGTLAHYCVNFSHLPMGSFTAVAPLAAVYLRVIADRVSRERWRESLGFKREAQRLGLWVFVMRNEFSLILLSLVIDHGARWCVLLLEILVNQFVLTFAISFNAFSYGVNIFHQRFIANSRIQWSAKQTFLATSLTKMCG